MMEFVSWDDELPTEWQVIKFHGSKPPTRATLTHHVIGGIIDIIVYYSGIMWDMSPANNQSHLVGG